MELKKAHFALAIAGAAVSVMLGVNPVSAAASKAEDLVFSRAKGNCLTCHEIKGGEAPGNIAPPLADMKARFPDRKELIAIISDETKRNPQTVMPPFKRNLLLTDQEIEAIVDFLYTH